MLSTQIHSASMDAGKRWMLNNAVGKPLRAWDSRGHVIDTTYDALHRPVQVFVTGIEGSPHQALVEQTVYGEGQGDAQNHRGKVYQHFDGAGIVTNVAYDFKGNVLESSRQLTSEYQRQVDWNAPPTLTETFTTTTRFDALNRPMEVLSPHNATTPASTIRPIYNEANLLNEIRVKLRGAQDETVFVRNIDYNAKGQRTLIAYGILDNAGNSRVQTTYDYDPETFRLLRLTTTRSGFPADASLVQDVHYTYDPAGNITHIRDDAQQTIYFNGAVAKPECSYTYDAIYRLIEASGREHIGQAGTPWTDWADAWRVHLPHPHEGQAMRRYTEKYTYDAVGNFDRFIHEANGGSWRRAYTYNEPSLLESAQTNNRLTRTTVGTGLNPLDEPYTHDLQHGFMTFMPHLPVMDWDYKDQLQVTQQQVVNPANGIGERTYYVYDAAGQRVRKVTELPTQIGTPTSKKDERIYLGGFEIYRKYNGNGSTATLERETLHVMDDQQRIALVETKTVDASVPPATLPSKLIRYQFSNHLGSASLELDDNAQIISYEEYYPYGSTSYQAVRSQTEAPKRYRYTGKERDEESGLYYYGARYYAPWLGRWVSADPSQLIDGTNLFRFAVDNSVTFTDRSGRDTVLPSWEEFRGNVQAAQAWINRTVETAAEQYHDYRLKQITGKPSELDRIGDALDAALLETAGKVVGSIVLSGPNAVIAVGEAPERIEHGAFQIARGIVVRNWEPVVEGVGEIAETLGDVASVGLQIAGGVQAARVRAKVPAPALEGQTAGTGRLLQTEVEVGSRVDRPAFSLEAQSGSGSQASSAITQGSATAKPTSLAGAKAVHSPRVSNAPVRTEPYNKGKGHHVPAQAALRRSPGYDPKTALAIPKGELERLGVRHPDITTGQRIPYLDWAESGKSLNPAAMLSIELNALIEAGIPWKQAIDALHRMWESLPPSVKSGPFRIPWGGKP